MNETKICKYCKTEIPKDAKVCPNCRKKQKGKLGIVIAVVVILLVIGVVAGGGDNSSSSSSTDTATESSSNNDSTATKEEADVQAEPEIEYISTTKQELSEALKANALKASDTYKGKYLEVTGHLSNVDSNGKYINIDAGEGDYSFVMVQCYIKNDDQKAAIMDLNNGDAVTIKGKCTDVGELLGYSIDIDEIIVN